MPLDNFQNPSVFELPTTGIERRYDQGYGSAALAGGAGGNWRLPPGLVDAGAHVRNVQDNELTSYHLTRGLAKNGGYIQGVRGRAARNAASRGSFNTNLAVAGAEAAGIDAYAPIAAQDAGVYASTASQNQESLNTMRIAQERNMTDIGTTRLRVFGDLAGRRMQITADEQTQLRDQSWRTGEREADQEFRNSEREDDQAYRTDEREDTQAYNTSEREANNEFAYNFARDMRGMDTFIQNPDLWNDPAAAEGFMNLLRGIFNRNGTSQAPTPTGTQPGTKPPGSNDAKNGGRAPIYDATGGYGGSSVGTSRPPVDAGVNDPATGSRPRPRTRPTSTRFSSYRARTGSR